MLNLALHPLFCPLCFLPLRPILLRNKHLNKMSKLFYCEHMIHPQHDRRKFRDPLASPIRQRRNQCVGSSSPPKLIAPAPRTQMIYKLSALTTLPSFSSLTLPWWYIERRRWQPYDCAPCCRIPQPRLPCPSPFSETKSWSEASPCPCRNQARIER
jgi:hypothetical protein